MLSIYNICNCLLGFILENDHDLNRRLMVIEDICTVYKRVAKIPSDNGLRQTFREMFEMDMKVRFFIGVEYIYTCL